MVLKSTREQKYSRKTLINRRNKVIGYILKHFGLVSAIMVTIVNEKQGRGRPQLAYMRQIIDNVS